MKISHSPPLDPFSLPTAKKINKIIKNLDVSKCCGPDKIPTKIVKMSYDILDTTFVMNYVLWMEVSLKIDFRKMQKCKCTLTLQKYVRSSKLNYRAVSLLHPFLDYKMILAYLRALLFINSALFTESKNFYHSSSYLFLWNNVWRKLDFPYIIYMVKSEKIASKWPKLTIF